MAEKNQILAVDIGNSQICFGIYRDGRLDGAWRIRTDPKETEDELRITIQQLMAAGGIRQEDIAGAILATVVPPLTETMIGCLTKLFGVKVVVVGPGTKTGVRILMDNPREVGADRIVNAVAVTAKYPGGCIVVDTGTATTFDCISPNAEYLGGVIAPGIAISSEALFFRAAKLPKVEIARPPACLGKNTVESMQSGIFFGYVGLIDGMIERLKGELDFRPQTIATGGYARLIASEAKNIDIVDENLTLDGLAILYEKNIPPAV
ncbi:MAG: type III pantothenate kinase [Pseudomonadota bacterium]